MIPNFWIEFCILFLASIVGAAAVVPYSLRLLRSSAQKKPLRMSIPVLALLSVVQTTVLCGIAIAAGLLAAHMVGLGAPYIEAILAGASLPSGIGLEIGIIFGVLAGAILLIADLFFLPYWPQPILDATKSTTTLENFLASLYGGINEELLMRLFGFSVLVWLLSFVWQPNPLIFWSINVVMAIVFGIGHLPALKSLVGKVSHVMLLRTLLLNAPVGLICGWLFWTYGIEAAIAAHFSADIVYHVFGTVVLRRKLGVTN
jgi:hypothetical protein